MAEYANPEVLVDTDWLDQNINDENIAVIEVDEDTQAYEKGHIPNALTIDWESELHDLPRRASSSLLREQLAELLGEKGIKSGDTIVLYSGNNNWFAAYAYWLFAVPGASRTSSCSTVVARSGSSTSRSAHAPTVPSRSARQPFELALGACPSCARSGTKF